MASSLERSICERQRLCVLCREPRVPRHQVKSSGVRVTTGDHYKMSIIVEAHHPPQLLRLALSAPSYARIDLPRPQEPLSVPFPRETARQNGLQQR